MDLGGQSLQVYLSKPIPSKVCMLMFRLTLPLLEFLAECGLGPVIVSRYCYVSALIKHSNGLKDVFD